MFLLNASKIAQNLTKYLGQFLKDNVLPRTLKNAWSGHTGCRPSKRKQHFSKCCASAFLF